MNPEDWKSGSAAPYTPPAKNGGPAFPVNTANIQSAGACYADPGMTLRDYFAAKAMQAYTAASQYHGTRICAIAAYEMADAMLAAREAQS